MNKLPKIDLGRKEGFPFAMVFAFLPEGTQIITGDLGEIRNYLNHGPTCHGVVNFYKNGVKLSSLVEVFGKGSFNNRLNNGIYVYLYHNNFNRGDSIIGKMLKLNSCDRKIYALSLNNKDDTKLLLKFRKLPNYYLPIFKELDKGKLN